MWSILIADPRPPVAADAAKLRHFFHTFTPQFAGVNIVAAMTPFPFYIGS